MEDLRNKNVLVVGLARTGLAVAEFLLDQGARVTITDHLPAEDLGSAADSALRSGMLIGVGRPSRGSIHRCGSHRCQSWCSSELTAALQEARSKSVPIIGELELASRFLESARCSHKRHQWKNHYHCSGG